MGNAFQINLNNVTFLQFGTKTFVIPGAFIYKKKVNDTY